jgi:tetratricopeptide (TPR) repeat protein
VKRRLPTHLLTILFWCAAWGGISLWTAASGDLAPERRAWLAGLGLSHLGLLGGLWALRPWARWLGGAAFAALAVFAGTQLALAGFSGMRLGCVFFGVWSSWYLFSGSTRDLFGGRNVGAISLQGIAPLGILVLGAAVIAGLGLSRGPTFVLGVVLVLTYLVGEERMRAWLAVYLAPRPEELKGDDWRCFQHARRARLAGDFARCEQLLGKLSGDLRETSRAARILAGLATLDRAAAGVSLATIVLCGDGERERDPQLDAALAKWVELATPAEILEPVRARAQLIDLLLEDAADPRSCFALEFATALGSLTGEHFVTNAEQGYARWWREQRERQTEAGAYRWLVVRAWRAESYLASVVLARREDLGAKPEATLIAAADLARTFAEASTRLTEPAWRESEHDRLVLAVSLADGMGWLLLDAPYLEKRGVVRLSGRIDERRALIERARNLWEEFPHDAGPTARWLLHLLTDAPVRSLRRRLRFDRYWSTRGTRQQEHERAFLGGLAAAAEQMWDVAAASFSQAVALAPERTTPLYNQAYALLESQRHDEAQPLLSELTRREPDESFWWLRLGDCLRQQGDLHAALEAYGKAVEQEGLGGRVALRLGLALVADGQEQEAERFLDAALEQVNEPGLTEQLAAVLEAEGAYDLARRYHHRAFLQQLERKDSWDMDDEGDAPPELV